MPAPVAAPPQQDAISLSPPARQKFGTNLIRTITKTVAAPAVAQRDVPLINRFLELAAVLDLNPLANEIWLANMTGRDGAPGRLAVLVGRDGYLKISRRDPNFIDVDADTVYEHDHFAVVRKADGTRSIEHSYGHPKDRGRLFGAYAVLRRRGFPDRYFYAPLGQYEKNPEKSAWKYTDSMIIKAASSYIMRTTYGISGPVPADEIGTPLAFPAGEGPDAMHVASSEPLDSAIAPLWERVKLIDPLAFNEGALRARTRNATPAQINQVAHELETWLREHEPAGEEIADAEVVPDDEPVPVDDEAERRAQAAVDVFDAASERFRSDAEWRTQVLGLMNRRMDLEIALNEGDVDGETPLGIDAMAELNQLDGAIRDLGVPDGWAPPSFEEPGEFDGGER